MDRQHDRIAYLLVTVGGGQDGMDASDAGGKVVAASFDIAQIEKKKGLDSRYEIVKRIVEHSDVVHSLTKLDPLDKLLVANVLMDERNHIMAGIR